MEAKGIFANNVSLPVEIYVNNKFYKTVEPYTEILMPGILEFTIYIPKIERDISIAKNCEYYYTWTNLDDDGEIRGFTVEQIQYYSNAHRTFNSITGEKRPLDTDQATLMQDRWKRIQKYNNLLLLKNGSVYSSWH